MRYTIMRPDGFKELAINAGILLKDFTPATGAYKSSDILGLSSGGFHFSAKQSIINWGADVDNCPELVKQLIKGDFWTATMGGTFVSITPALAAKLLAAGDIDGTDATKIVPRNDIKLSDYADLWLVGDYGEKTGDTKGGHFAIHMLNSRSSDGFDVQTKNKDKTSFAFTFAAYYDMADITTVPFEIYAAAGEDEPTS